MLINNGFNSITQNRHKAVPGSMCIQSETPVRNRYSRSFAKASAYVMKAMAFFATGSCIKLDTTN
jgi:hypothetical protein